MQMGKRHLFLNDLLEMKKITILCFLILFLMGMNTPNQAQMIDTITMIPYPKIWIEHSLVELELDLPWAEFLGSYSPSKESHKGSFSYKTNHEKGTFKAKFSVVDELNEKPDFTCFPIICIDLPKKQINGSIWEGQDKYQLLILCDTPIKEDTNSLMLEYLAYQLFQKFHPVFFYSRLCRVNIIETGKAIKISSSLALLIEYPNEMAKRYRGKLLDLYLLHPNFCESTTMARVSLFEWMIGNSNWSVQRLHGLQLVSMRDFPPVAVPLYFSNSKFVKQYVQNPFDTPYKGICSSEELLLNEMQRLISFQDEFLRLIDQSELPIQIQSKAKQYIIEFMNAASKSAEFQEFIHDQCQKE
ncbi:MAG TPA: hypothetical protein DCP10_03195 [Bacteroidales bacterium]|nr:hypothetical protein [Bacteroidales bacterium]